MHHHTSVFKNESKLDINYVPLRLPHRQFQLNLLNQFFRFAIENPGKMTQRVLITGNVGTGKTVLSQHFGLDVARDAKERGINLNCVHVNCRECKGSLFMILQRAILNFHPHFPKRGYSAEELLQTLMQILDEQNAYLILVIDELEALIQIGGSDPLYKLTRIQEDRLKAPQRFSLICILREPEYLDRLDHSTRSTLQRNIIRLEEYSASQLQDILKDRVDLAFKYGTVSASTLHFIANLASSEGGDARYGIELLWRAGKYADASGLPEVSPECVRKAVADVYPVVRKGVIFSLSFHEKLFLLGVTRCFKHSEAAYLPMGAAEDAYAVVCEEYDAKKRGHTQLWKYVKKLSVLGIIRTELSSVGQRGKTTYISLPGVPASDLEQELTKILSTEKRRSNPHVN
jgi:cell division control protein 6